VAVQANEGRLVDNDELGEFLLFDANIPNQDIEYLGSDKVKQLAQLFCQQVGTEYSDFSTLSAVDQQTKVHKLKGAAIGLGLVRLYQLCQQLEVSLQGNKLSEAQLAMIDELMHLSKEALNKYAASL